MSLEGSGTPRRAGASDPGAAVPPDPEPAPFSATYDVAKQNDLELSRASMPTLPPPRRAGGRPHGRRVLSGHHRGDLRGARRRARGVPVGEDAGVVPVLPAVRPAAARRPDAAGAKMSVVAVEPLPGSPDVHHMHLHVCDADSRAFQTHAALFEGTSRPGRASPLVDAGQWVPRHGVDVPPRAGARGIPRRRRVHGRGRRRRTATVAVRRVVLEVHYDGADAMKGAAIQRFASVGDERLGERRETARGFIVRRGPVRASAPEPARGHSGRALHHALPAGVHAKAFAAPLRVFASMTHAHLRAKHVLTSVGTPDSKTGLVPEGDGPSTSGWRVVVDAKDDAGAFSHDRQKFEPPSLPSSRGTRCARGCRYDTRASSSIPFGPATSQEMCMQVFLYYPKQPEFLCGTTTSDGSGAATRRVHRARRLRKARRSARRAACFESPKKPKKPATPRMSRKRRRARRRRRETNAWFSKRTRTAKGS